MQTYKTKIIQLMLWLAFATTFVSGQKPKIDSDIITVETKAVFTDVLVRDKATRKPVSDLQREDFMLLIDNKPREISEFGFDRTKSCPLTIILYFNLAPNGALRYLEQPKTQKSLGEALSKLDEDDEVAVMTAPDWFVGQPQFRLKPTRNREEVAKAIAEATNGASLNGQNKPKPDRINKSTMTDAITAVEKTAGENRARKIALVYISDGINTLDTMDFGDRRQLAGRLLKSNISFSALNFELPVNYSVAANIINPLAFAFGASVTGSMNYFAGESGGVAVKVEKAENLGSALEEIINLYGSRYNLGFYLDETDKDAGKMHKIEVKVHGRSKLLINVRRGFFTYKK